MTGGERTAWAAARRDFIDRPGAARRSAAAIEGAAFVVALDDSAYGDDLAEFAREAFHGSGDNRWFDKSFNLIVDAKGKMALNVEHSW